MNFILLEGDKMNIVDRFLYKLTFMSILLAFLVCMDHFKIINFDKVQIAISDNINFLKIINSVNGKTNFIAVDLEDETSVSGGIMKTQDILNGKRVILDDFEGVENISLGVVVKIIDHTVYVLDNDDYLYCYKDLEDVNVKLYQIVKKSEIIGKANYKDDINYYDVYITKNGKTVSLLP